MKLYQITGQIVSLNSCPFLQNIELIYLFMQFTWSIKFHSITNFKFNSVSTEQLKLQSETFTNDLLHVVSDKEIFAIETQCASIKQPYTTAGIVFLITCSLRYQGDSIPSTFDEFDRET